MSAPRLVVTVGPASYHLAEQLLAAGADAFRINASHLEPAELGERVAALRSTAELPVVVDLQGAKMRIGDLTPRQVEEGDAVVFALSPSGAGEVAAPHPELFDAVAAGETLAIRDGQLQFAIEEVADGRISTRCQRGGQLEPRQGLTAVEHPIRLTGLTAIDEAALAAAISAGATELAFSFMLDGGEAAWLRATAPGARITGKVERREALAALPAIADACDEVWLCRGDLGAQLGLPALARAVAAVDPRSLSAPMLIAGGVLEQLGRRRQASRSEVCHLYDLLARGFAGVVLSDETAIGRHPLHAVQQASALLRELSRPSCRES